MMFLLKKKPKKLSKKGKNGTMGQKTTIDDVNKKIPFLFFFFFFAFWMQREDRDCYSFDTKSISIESLTSTTEGQPITFPSNSSHTSIPHHFQRTSLPFSASFRGHRHAQSPAENSFEMNRILPPPLPSLPQSYNPFPIPFPHPHANPLPTLYLQPPLLVPPHMNFPITDHHTSNKPQYHFPPVPNIINKSNIVVSPATVQPPPSIAPQPTPPCPSQPQLINTPQQPAITKSPQSSDANQSLFQKWTLNPAAIRQEKITSTTTNAFVPTLPPPCSVGSVFSSVQQFKEILEKYSEEVGFMYITTRNCPISYGSSDRRLIMTCKSAGTPRVAEHLRLPNSKRRRKEVPSTKVGCESHVKGTVLNLLYFICILSF
jgi:hypothetical protein